MKCVVKWHKPEKGPKVVYNMELDLNQEPLDQTLTSVVEFDSVLDELEVESGEGHIRNRIRHLEAVTSRARQRQRWPPVHSPIQITNFTGEATTADAEGEEGREQQDVEEGIVESGKGGKRRSAHLIAKALGVEEPDAGKATGSSGNFFDCNICLDMARDPILTCCGHLFCWPCFYQLSYAYSKAKECPVCKGEVTESGIIPIYGNANAGGDCQLELELKEAGLSIPPRPRAPRIESIRQKLISQGASSSIIQNIRRFHNRNRGLGEQVQSESPNTTTVGNNGLLTQSRPRTDNNQHTGSHTVSRLLVQGASSFSTLSSALNSAMDSAERLVQDLESYIHRHQIGGSRQLNPRAVNGNSNSSLAVTNRSESLIPDVAMINSATAASVSPISRNVDNVDVRGSEILTTDRNGQISVLDPSSSNGRRRNGVSRQVSNEPRRRRRLR